jgi:hypothetical protein
VRIVPETSLVTARLSPLLLLTALALLFFHDLVWHPDQVLYSDHSDLIAQHIPAKRFLVRSWRESGELPLWCPYSFGGSPFIHDIQVAAFYPPHALLYVLPEERVGMALSFLIVLHVIVAGLGMYAYAREQGWTRSSSFVSAIGFMFAGAWLLRLLAGGHYLLIGLAWLPLVLLLLERAIRRGSVAWSTAAGGVYALLILGTPPQYTFYASLLIALWTLGVALEVAGLWVGPGGLSVSAWRRTLGRWLGHGVWAVLLGVGLSAVQLLPTAEAARYSTRALGIGSSEVLAGGLRSLLFLVGPAMTAEPANLLWEDRGGLTLLWLFAALLAALEGRGRLRYLAAVTGLLFFFAVSGAVIVQGSPGFRLFRQPARMFVILGFPAAFLAGAATQLLFAGEEARPDLGRRGRRLLSRLLVALAILAGGFALRLALEGKAILFSVYWFSLLLTVPALFWLLGRSSTAPGRWRLGLWTLLLMVDLWSLTAPLVATRREEALYQPSQCLDRLAEARDHGRLLDRDNHPGDTGTPLGTGAPFALLLRLEALRGYNPIDYIRYKEYLQFIAGSDAPLQALGGPLTFPVLGDFPIVHKPLLDLLGVRHLLQPASSHLEQGGWQPVLHDERPEGYDFIAGGVRALPPYTLYENRTVLPRAFFVFRAAVLPERDAVLRHLLRTDFRDEVLLETPSPTNSDLPEHSERQVVIRHYDNNRVTIGVEAGPAGWLILTDIWYPGWTCRIDGASVEVQRANYLFRAVRVPEGVREVVFAFEPASYYRGQTISVVTLAVVGAVLVLGGLWRIIRTQGITPAGEFLT